MKKNCHRNPHYVDKAVGSLAMSKYFSDELLSQYLPSLNILCCRNLILGIYFQVSKDLAKRKLNFFFLQIFIHSRVSSGWNQSNTNAPVTSAVFFVNGRSGDAGWGRFGGVGRGGPGPSAALDVSAELRKLTEAAAQV